MHSINMNAYYMLSTEYTKNEEGSLYSQESLYMFYQQHGLLSLFSLPRKGHCLVSGPYTRYHSITLYYFILPILIQKKLINYSMPGIALEDTETKNKDETVSVPKKLFQRSTWYKLPSCFCKTRKSITEFLCHICDSIILYIFFLTYSLLYMTPSKI